jgi:hypothetical protein
MMAASRVRPYAITGGRTRPDHDLADPARVLVPRYDPARAASLLPEAMAIYERARQPISVADLTAHLPNIPATTLLVLLSDLITAGLVQVEGGAVERERDMLGRILEGLKELSP